MPNQELLNKVQVYVEKLLQQSAPEESVYHSLQHTKEVVNEINEINKVMNLDDDDYDMLQIAGWFHDVGYIKQCEGHEDISSTYAREFLSKETYSQEKINKVESLIKSTRMPQNPHNILEQIMCDADLHHLGINNCELKGDLFRKELELKNNMVFTEEQWLQKSVDFFNQHKFFTTYAKSKYDAQKNINIIKLEKQLKKAKKKNKNNKLKEDKLNLDKEKIELKKREKTSSRTIETMFRNTVRTHVEFSAMADTKANIMISVNTLVLTIIVSIMVRKLDSNPHLIIPTALLTLTSLVTLVYAILVTRPKISSGMFLLEDIEKKRVNLLFFGNFFKMSLKDFTWGMNELINDQEFLFDSMIKDFYYLGQVLGIKYKKLRFCYTFFMYGVIISVIAFAIAFILFPEGTNLGGSLLE